MFNLKDAIDDEQLRLSAECDRLRKELDVASKAFMDYLQQTDLTSTRWTGSWEESLHPVEDHWCEDCH